VKTPKTTDPFVDWMNEQGPDLRPAIFAYLNNEPLRPAQFAVIRTYLTQWMAADWKGDGIEYLRREVARINSREKLTAWLEQALRLGLDPL
jgi:hypothetical protein